MAITHFSIVELPDSNVIESMIDGSPIVIDTKYPIANENLLSWARKTAFESKPVEIGFVYKVHDDVNVRDSNSALGQLKWVGVEETPLSEDLELVILNDEEINLLEVLPLNDAVDFIFISAMVGVQNLETRSSSVFVTQNLNIVDLFYTLFKSEVQGGGDPYFLLTYFVGKNGTVGTTPYTLKLNIVSLALLTKLSPVIVTGTEDIDTGSGIVNYPTKDETIKLEISLAHAYGLANIDIVINSPFLSLNPYNSVILNYNGEQREEFANITINADIELDKLGKATIVVTNAVVQDTLATAEGEVTITVNSVNGDPALVNGTQEEVLTSSL